MHAIIRIFQIDIHLLLFLFLCFVGSDANGGDSNNSINNATINPTLDKVIVSNNKAGCKRVFKQFHWLWFEDTAATCYSDPNMLDFIWAIENNDLKTMKKLYRQGIDLNAKGKYDFTPLVFALGSSYECYRWLLDNGANPNVYYTIPIDKGSVYETIRCDRFIHDAFIFFLNTNNELNFITTFDYLDKQDFKRYLNQESGFVKELVKCRSLPDKSITVLNALARHGADFNPPDCNLLFNARHYKIIAFLLVNGADETRIVKRWKTDNKAESYIDQFSRLHRTMEGFTYERFESIGKENYPSYKDERDGFRRSDDTVFLEDYLSTWSSYWEVVNLLRSKGYPLNNEKESAALPKYEYPPELLEQIRTRRQNFIIPQWPVPFSGTGSGISPPMERSKDRMY